MALVQQLHWKINKQKREIKALKQACDEAATKAAIAKLKLISKRNSV